MVKERMRISVVKERRRISIDWLLLHGWIAGVLFSVVAWVALYRLVEWLVGASG
jgi:hypothetical protein